MQYRIYEGNIERLEKKLNRIAKKCKKYGNDFKYEQVGEEFSEYTDDDGNKYTVRYVLVEAEGKAVINDWKFIACVEHTNKGNIISKCGCEVEVPERYYTSESICEHCNSKRYRKDTYIVQNTETGEFKQVGKSCLKDFTCGMSAEGIASYISLFDELIQGEVIEGGYNGTRYIDVREALQYIAETIRHFGYVKSDDIRPTKQRAREYYGVEHGMFSGYYDRERAKELRAEMKSVSFKYDSEYAKELTENVLKWVEEQEESTNYIHNLKTVCNLEYVSFDKFGLLASMFPTYDKQLVREKQKVEEKAQEQQSEYVGNVGDRITVQIAEFKIVTSWETEFGLIKIFKIVDTDGNIYTWKTSGGIADGTETIIGTVKAHNKYRDVKQTELTRVRKASNK